MSGNEKTKLKLLKKCTLSVNWNTYDPFGEVVFFAVGPFLKHSVFLARAFAFGCGFFWAPAFAFGCGLLREPSSSFTGVPNYRFPLGPGSPRAGKNSQNAPFVRFVSARAVNTRRMRFHDKSSFFFRLHKKTWRRHQPRWDEIAERRPLDLVAAPTFPI